MLHLLKFFFPRRSGANSLQWKCASKNEPRVINLHLRSSEGGNQPDAPGFLTASKESRSETSRDYTACKEVANIKNTRTTRSRTIYIDFRIDQLWIQCSGPHPVVPTIPLNFDHDILPLIERLTFRAAINLLSWYLPRALNHWCSLPRLTHIVLAMHTPLHFPKMSNEDTLFEEMVLQMGKAAMKHVDGDYVLKDVFNEEESDANKKKLDVGFLWPEYRELDLVPMSAGL
ncbi:uncharacterized protein LY89DRAFT_742125 [Mollisia scopiformis]|uniref:Uncharacterized protein n=1 Tax=Mollisia scopiformis TaxID=149040 RepID=A0A132B7A2_MOLSC|nr:uncharacterized protein LY89DRAFT_742125 [Mollisia scopiformis]KUJ08288.1 hypothetical protein LY89DRAFT_742125 [Mollisia scopiformis]